MTVSTISLSSGALSAEISLKGAELQRLVTGEGRDLLWDGDPAVWAGRAPIMFPVIGVLNNGEYHYDGRSYPMPKHGLARHAMFACVEQSADAARLRLGASDETRAIYPFEFQLDLVFALEDSTLTMRAVIANLGDKPMPASFGFHPALRWPLPFGQPREAHRIVFAEAEPQPIRRIDTAGLLTPDALPTPVVGDTLILRDDLFVDDALIFDRLTSRSLRYGASSGPQLEVRFDDFPSLGIWTKPGAHYVCIEPWHGSADPIDFTGDIREKPGIFEVPAGEARSLGMSISLIG